MIETAFTYDDQINYACYSPKLAEAISKVFIPDLPVYDFGCGPGMYVKYLQDAGFKAEGYDGTPDIENITNCPTVYGSVDITKFMSTSYPGNVICLEVIEHIQKEMEQNVLDNLKRYCSRSLILSWAVKGQGGKGHINEQNSDYVIPKLESMGFVFDDETSNYLREAGGRDLWWFSKSIYFFTINN